MNKYTYVRNNPLRYIDPDGHDITFATPGLEALYHRFATESTTFAEELDADRKPNPNFVVNVVERALRQNDEKSSGDATVSRKGQQVSVTVYIDSRGRTSDSTVAHEQGHVKDARTNINQLMQDGARTKKNKGAPGAPTHNERPEEKRADKFRDQVPKEQQAYRRAEKERRKQEQLEKKRKKKDEQ